MKHVIFAPALAICLAFPALAEETATTTNAAAEPAVAFVLDEALVKKGKKVFKKCKACHKVGENAKNGVGPQLNGIVGRAAGSVDWDKYSPALQAAAADGLVWTLENLDGFLTKPKDFMPGTKMTFAGLKKEKDRVAILEYLKSLSQPAE